MVEHFLAVNVADKGMIVFTACSHAGVINVLKHAKSCFSGVPVYAVVGGLHLAGVNERIIPETVKAMREFDLAVIAAAHCTSWRAITALANAFGDKLVLLSAGILPRRRSNLGSSSYLPDLAPPSRTGARRRGQLSEVEPTFGSVAGPSQSDP